MNPQVSHAICVSIENSSMMLPQFGQIFSMIVGVRGLPWQPLSIERNPSTAGQRPAAAFLVFFLVLLYIMIA